MKARMERILIKLAQRHAAHLLQNLPAEQDERLRRLADGLAKNGILVIVGDVPSDNYDTRVSQWVGAYGDLYRMLVRALFPSFAGLDAVYADDQRPPIIVMEGESAATMQALGQFVAPYIALREGDTLVSEMELRGVMTYILDELEANDLPNELHTYLWQEGARIIDRLLKQPVKHYAVTSFARPLFQQLQGERHTPPQPTRAHQTPPPPPELLPDEPQAADMTATQEMFRVDIPLFSAGRKSGDLPRKPPVPLPPRRDEDD